MRLDISHIETKHHRKGHDIQPTGDHRDRRSLRLLDSQKAISLRVYELATVSLSALEDLRHDF